ncbi:uracil-DNA glycosylase-like protein [Chytriomyces cf. hyalinus JEL632]|nr:uracil-DNA glycosylase-like protein [Chytriomyces cf. hyalinus JEL632]
MSGNNTSSFDPKRGTATTLLGSISRFAYNSDRIDAEAVPASAPSRVSTRGLTRQCSSRSIKREAVDPDTDDAQQPNEGPDTSAVRNAPKKRKKSVPGSKVVLFPELDTISDSLAPNLICVFIGINPGVQTSITGHAYAHRSNWFWKLLYSSACVDRLLPPRYDQELPRLFSLGLTNLVSRPTANQAQLSVQEKEEGVPILAEKIRVQKPESICFVGKDIWKIFHKIYFGVAMDEKEFQFGWQKLRGTTTNMRITGLLSSRKNPSDVKLEDLDLAPHLIKSENGTDVWEGALVFVSFSTSGLVSFSPEFKRQTWVELGVYVNERRAARGELSPKEAFDVTTQE